MKIIFIGFFCAGKTTHGIKYAKEKDLHFFDTDDLIEERFKLPVYEVYHKYGEEKFREIEHEILCSIDESEAVIATGGGTPMSEENQKLLKEMGELIYLEAPFQTLYKRILNRRFPSFADPSDPYASCEKIYHYRHPIYSNLADKTIDTKD